VPAGRGPTGSIPRRSAMSGTGDLRGAWRRPAAALLAVVSAAACGERGAGTGPLVTVDTLAGGVVQVMNRGAAGWEATGGWELREELRIGRAEGEGPDVFGRVAAIEADAGGRIFVLDSQAREVRVFDPDGRHLRTMGREGEGPGEFLAPVGLSIHPSDGRLWVVDGRNARYTLFDPEGAFGTTQPRPLGFMALPWPGGFDRRGGLHDIGSDAEGLVVVRFDSLFAPADTFRIPQPEQDRVTVVRADGTPVMSITSPLAPRLHWSFDPQGFVWTATSDAFRFTRHTLAGDPVRIVVREHRPVPVTSAEADSVMEAVETVISMNAGPDARVEGTLRAPDHKPAFRAFRVDRVGRLWVEPQVGPDDARVLNVFGADGVYLGAVDIDPGLDLVSVIPRIDESRMYALVRDELDVPYVVRYRIVEPSTP
jgi:hypothetical protein